MSHCSRYNGLHVETVYNKEEIRSQLDLDQQIASELQELYNSEVDGDVCIPSECLEDNELNACSILKELAKNVDKSRQFFFVTRREARLQRVISIWQREVSQNPSINGTIWSNLWEKEGLILELCPGNS